MRFDRSTVVSRAVNTIAVLLGMVSTFAGCSEVNPLATPLTEPSACPSASTSALIKVGKCSTTISFDADDFACGGGTDCTGSLHRRPCPPCAAESVDFQVIVFVGEKTAEVKTGQVHFAKGAGTAALQFRTAAPPTKLMVELSLDGTLVHRQAVIPTTG